MLDANDIDSLLRIYETRKHMASIARKARAVEIALPTGWRFNNRSDSQRLNIGGAQGAAINEEELVSSGMKIGRR